MTTPPKDVHKLAQLLLDVAALAGEPGPAPVPMPVPPPSVDTGLVEKVVRSVLADCAVDTLPYSYSVESAAAATGLSKWKINELVRDDKIAVRQDGVKLIIDGASLRRYIDSRPPRGLR